MARIPQNSRRKLSFSSDEISDSEDERDGGQRGQKINKDITKRARVEKGQGGSNTGNSEDLAGPIEVDADSSMNAKDTAPVTPSGSTTGAAFGGTGVNAEGTTDVSLGGIKMNSDSILTKLFDMKSSMDVTIIPGYGKPRECHGSILAAQCPGLAANAKLGIVDSSTGRIIAGSYKMPENSSIGITHLILYLYGFEVSDDELTYVAVEMFKTAHKYDLTQLLEYLGSTSRTLLVRRSDFHSLDDILGLYFYVKDIASLATFRQELLSIMKRVGRELRSCETYKGLTSKQREGLLLEVLDA